MSIINEVPKLKEIQSICIKNTDIENQISGELNRLKLLNDQEAAKSKQLEDNKESLGQITKEINELENKLASIDLSLSKKAENLNYVTKVEEETGLNKEIANLKESQEVTEEKLIELFDTQEAHNNSIKEVEEFISGIKQTISEIKKEVDTFESESNNKIQINNDRIIFLKSELSKNSIQTLDALLNKKVNPFLANNHNGHCGVCRFAFDRSHDAEIETKDSFLTCPSCYRLILPTF